MPKQSETGNVKKLCGCARAKWSSCAHPWYVDFKAPKHHARRASQRYRKNLDLVSGKHATNLREAQDEARRAITAWLDGRDPLDLQPVDRPTLEQVLTQYVKRPNAPTNERRQVKPVIETTVHGRRFGDYRITEITHDVIEAFRAQRPKVAGNRNLALLRPMFKYAVLAKLVDATPFRYNDVVIIKLAREESRTRRLQAGEELKLLAGCDKGMDKRGHPWNGNPQLQAFIIAALETGCRLGELQSLQWHQVGRDLFLPAGKTKARRSRRVPISTRLQRLLDGRRNDPAGEPLPPNAYVFGDELGRRHGAIKTAWRLLCGRVKIDDLHFHDLRREAGSRWMDANVPLATIQRWLGHAKISQTSTYLAATLGSDDADMRAYEERIGRLPQIDISGAANGSQPSLSDRTVSEKTEQNAVVH